MHNRHTCLIAVIPYFTEIGEAGLGDVTVRRVSFVEVEAVAAGPLVAELPVVPVVEGDGVAAELAPEGRGGVRALRLRVLALHLAAVLGGPVVVVAVEELDGAADVLPRRAQGRVVVQGRCGGTYILLFNSVFYFVSNKNKYVCRKKYIHQN